MKKRNIIGHQYKASNEDSDARADPEGGQGSGLPLKNHKNIGFPSNIGPDPLKSQSYQASIQCSAIIGTPVKHHLNGVSLTR